MDREELSRQNLVSQMERISNIIREIEARDYNEARARRLVSDLVTQVAWCGDAILLDARFRAEKFNAE